MFSHESLIEKGFSLNEYPEGKFYENTITDENTILKIYEAINMEYDPEMIDDQIILQVYEDFSNVIISVGGDVWDLDNEEFEKVLNVL